MTNFLRLLKTLPTLVCCLLLSIFITSNCSAENANDYQSVLDEYAHILDLEPAQSSPVRSQAWQIAVSTHNTGLEKDKQWRQSLAIFNEKINRRGDRVWLAADAIDYEADYSMYGVYDGWLAGTKGVSEQGQWRWQVALSVSYFDAAAFDDDYDYDEYSWFTELSLSREWLVRHDTLLAVAGGVRYENIDRSGLMPNQLREGANATWNVTTEQNLLLPGVSLSLVNLMGAWDSRLQLRYLKNIKDPELSGDDMAVTRLGRFDATFKYQQLALSIEQSWAKSPFSYYRRAWQTEFSWSLDANYGFDDRLLAQAQWSLGGAQSVRGYEESLISADNVAYIRTQVYRRYWHGSSNVLFRPSSLQSLYIFADYGYAQSAAGNAAELGIVEDAESFTMAGSGLGMHLQLFYGIELKAEIAWALRDIEGLAESGDVELHADLQWKF